MFREARNVDHLRKTTRREQSWPQREAMGATANRSTIGAEPKLFEAHNLAKVPRDTRSETGI